MTKAEIIKSHCNKCGNETKHFRLSRKTKKGSEEIEEFGFTVSWQEDFDFLECCGCENISMRCVSWFSEDDDVAVTNYPPSISRRKPKWIDKLTPALKSLMDEIYTALHANSFRLVSMGARTVLDMVILDKIGDVGTFGKKLEALEAQGYVGKKNREFLSAALDAGSAAAHRGHMTGSKEVGHVMDIVENLLEAVYVLQEAADNIKKLTPSRKQGTTAS